MIRRLDENDPINITIGDAIKALWTDPGEGREWSKREREKEEREGGKEGGDGERGEVEKEGGDVEGRGWRRMEGRRI